jgi:hypothetical protein
MKRRELLGLGVSGGLCGGIIITAVSDTGITLNDNSSPDYLEKKVVYNHTDLNMKLTQDVVQHGETVTFNIINNSESLVELGCNIPWALQKRSNGEWNHVTWTPQRKIDLCFSSVSPEGTTTIDVPLSRSELNKIHDVSEVGTELTSGDYRFILLEPDPQLAVDFQLQPSDTDDGSSGLN